MFHNNNLLCYENTINWKDILTGESSEVMHHRSSHDKTRECEQLTAFLCMMLCLLWTEVILYQKWIQMIAKNFYRDGQAFPPADRVYFVSPYLQHYQGLLVWGQRSFQKGSFANVLDCSAVSHEAEDVLQSKNHWILNPRITENIQNIKKSINFYCNCCEHAIQ